MAVPGEGDVNDLLFVHGVAQRLPDPNVVKGLFAVVEIQGLYQVHGALFDIEAVLKLGGLGAAEVGEQVYRPALEADDNAVRVLHNLKGHPIQIGRGAPVAVKPL